MISRLISSGWYHHLWCILTPTMWSMVLCIYQDQLVLPVSNIYQWAVKGMGCEPVTLTLARTLLVRLWVLVLLVDKHVPSICVKLMYIWAMLLTGQVFSVGCIAVTLAYFVSGFFYMVGLRLCDALSRCRHFWADVTPQGVIDLYIFLW